MRHWRGNRRATWRSRLRRSRCADPSPQRPAHSHTLQPTARSRGCAELGNDRTGHRRPHFRINMAIEITVPRVGWTMEEGIFLGWLKQDGDAVREGETLHTLESDKSAQEVEATESGVLRISPHAPAAGGTVRVGELLGYIAAEGESVSFDAKG